MVCSSSSTMRAPSVLRRGSLLMSQSARICIALASLKCSVLLKTRKLHTYCKGVLSRKSAVVDEELVVLPLRGILARKCEGCALWHGSAVKPVWAGRGSSHPPV
jgi:hypothetical protein